MDEALHAKKEQDHFDSGNFRVEGGPPQFVRLGGFREVFESHISQLDDTACKFGADDPVPCRCDTLHGTVECDVPRSDSGQAASEEVIVVKVRVAEFESPPLSVKYMVSPYEEHNVLLRADDDDVNAKDASTRYAHFLRMLTRDRHRNHTGKMYTLLHQCIAECIGTMFIVIFGVGVVCSAVTTQSGIELWQVASVWGFGVALAILVSASVSGAHLNPAVSLALALFRPHDFPFRKLIPYWIAQYLGGVLGGAFNLMIFGPVFRSYELANGIVRDGPNGVLTAKAFGEYFPDPTGAIAKDVISPSFAMLVEAWGTGILMFVILALTDPRQKAIRNKEMLPFYIGFTVAVLITLYAPLTQAGWNPARDFGPRIVAALAGWGRNAIPGPRNGFWVYIVGPKIGAPLGALAYDFFINPGLNDA